MTRSRFRFMPQFFILLSLFCCRMCLAAPQSETAMRATWNDSAAIPVSNVVVETDKQNEIAVDVPGTLITLTPSSRGGVVKKGQIVAEIDRTLAEAELRELEHKAQATFEIDFAKQAIDYAELTMSLWLKQNEEAGQDIFKPEEIQKQQLEIVKAKAGLVKAEHEKRLAELAAETKRLQIKQYTRRAQIDGIVTDLHKKSLGTSIRQGDPIMTIVDYEQMVVKLEVDPQYEARIGVGDKVIVRRQMTTPGGPRPNANSPFIRTEASADAAQKSDAAEYFFEGVVTFTGGVAKTDDNNSIEIEAVVKNRTSGNRNYLLKEGVRCEAVIVPQ